MICFLIWGEGREKTDFTMCRFAYKQNFERPERAKWAGREREQMKEGEGESDAAQGWAGLDGTGRATRCSPKQKHCRAQQAAGHKHQVGCEAASEQSTEFLIMF